MFKGSVSFEAQIKGNGLTFPRTEFDPQVAGVDKVDIEGPDGKELRSAVYFSSVASPEEAKSLAVRINEAALDRLAYNHGTVIKNARITSDQFSPINPQPGGFRVSGAGMVLVTGGASVTLGLDATTVQKELEQSSPPGERHYGLLRSACQSASPVEEFMHMYNIMLMLHDDKQGKLDRFIVAEEPTVRQTQHPEKKPGVMETVYTRLRNEFAHKRQGVDLQRTKADMADQLGGLRTLVKRAIELST